MNIVWIILGAFLYLFVGSFVTGLLTDDDCGPSAAFVSVVLWPIVLAVFVPVVFCSKIIDWARNISG